MDIAPISSHTPPVIPRPLGEVRLKNKWVGLYWIFGTLCFIVVGVACALFFPQSPLYPWRHAILPMVLGREYIVVQMGEVGDQYFDVKLLRARLLKPGRILITFRDDSPLVFGSSPSIPRGTVYNAEFRIPNIPIDPSVENAMPQLPRGTKLAVRINYDDTLNDDTIIFTEEEMESQTVFVKNIWGKTSFGHMTL